MEVMIRNWTHNIIELIIAVNEIYSVTPVIYNRPTASYNFISIKRITEWYL